MHVPDVLSMRPIPVYWSVSIGLWASEGDGTECKAYRVSRANPGEGLSLSNFNNKVEDERQIRPDFVVGMNIRLSQSSLTFMPPNNGRRFPH